MELPKELIKEFPKTDLHVHLDGKEGPHDHRDQALNNHAAGAGVEIRMG